MQEIAIPELLPNRFISTGLEPVLSHIEKPVASYYRQFSTNIKINILKLLPVLLNRTYGPSGLIKLVLILKFFILLSAERCLQYVEINNYSFTAP